MLVEKFTLLKCLDYVRRGVSLYRCYQKTELCIATNEMNRSFYHCLRFLISFLSRWGFPKGGLIGARSPPLPPPFSRISLSIMYLFQVLGSMIIVKRIVGIVPLMKKTSKIKKTTKTKQYVKVILLGHKSQIENRC